MTVTFICHTKADLNKIDWIILIESLKIIDREVNGLGENCYYAKVWQNSNPNDPLHSSSFWKYSKTFITRMQPPFLQVTLKFLVSQIQMHASAKKDWKWNIFNYFLLKCLKYCFHSTFQLEINIKIWRPTQVDTYEIWKFQPLFVVKRFFS